MKLDTSNPLILDDAILPVDNYEKISNKVLIANAEIAMESEMRGKTNIEIKKLKDSYSKNNQVPKIHIGQPNNYGEGRIFADCEFRFTDHIEVHFSQCTFIRCKFKGQSNFENINRVKTRLLIGNAIEISDCLFLDGFSDLSISNTTLTNCEITSKTNRLTIGNSTCSNVDFLGESNELSLVYCHVESEFFIKNLLGFDLKKRGWFEKFLNNNNLTKEVLSKIISYQSKAVWDFDIKRKGRFDVVSFSKIQVDPHNIITKVKDKSTLDLSDADIVDSWSKLRMKYSGFNLYVVLLLTIGFFAPLIINYSILISISDTMLSKFDFFNTKTTVFEMIIFGGKQGNEKIVFGVLTIILFLYNLIRIIVTFRVAKLKEKQSILNDSNFSVSTIHPNKLISLMFWDRILSFALYVSVFYTLYKVWIGMNMVVPNLYDLDLSQLVN